VYSENDASVTEQNIIAVNGYVINNTSLSHTISRNIKTMLFADVVGFSKLGEEEAPSFFVNFLQEIADIIHSHSVALLFIIHGEMEYSLFTMI